MFAGKGKIDIVSFAKMIVIRFKRPCNYVQGIFGLVFFFVMASFVVTTNSNMCLLLMRCGYESCCNIKSINENISILLEFSFQDYNLFHLGNISRILFVRLESYIVLQFMFYSAQIILLPKKMKGHDSKLRKGIVQKYTASVQKIGRTLGTREIKRKRAS